ncbi:TetR family transcriptional regulator [Actinosynnema sp. ALI-1.44]|uniref:TetR/AcrR family transcriptional regulator n=1 Tax=Actinosynnema sp. ALI-1.44 TaxID=1933779 RepID=UPI00097C15CB|nr:TetR/AcrR family transcriptional regulator [Actinosynnema sp. ALI-1.44]ONI82973.1 TetR family transcriptional regulator [Actinosynnema sp. ALI-1.44]
MPRLVNHAQRRREILEVTWRLIATGGAEAATMREIARRAGYANGALARYFPNKEALIEAAYVYVSEQTDERTRAATVGKRGVAALRAFLVELVPSEEITVLEARIVLPFWSRTVTDDQLARTNDAQLQRWRDKLVVLIREGRADGDVRTTVADELIAEQLLAMALGLQILGLLPEHPSTPRLQLRLIDTFVAGLK